MSLDNIEKPSPNDREPLGPEDTVMSIEIDPEHDLVDREAIIEHGIASSKIRKQSSSMQYSGRKGKEPSDGDKFGGRKEDNWKERWRWRRQSGRRWRQIRR